MIRRDFIGSSFGASALLAAGMPKRAAANATTSSESSIVPVRIDAGRVIRTMVGLRPFRAAGFVLRAQPFGEKLLVHNYGHGGGGFSLSWGCATLAADLASDRSPSHAAVLGCGVIGLTTARILQDRGWQVTIYAADLPPQTTSNIAGAQWTPVSLFVRDRVTPAFMDTFRKAARIANRRFQLMAGPTYGVRWLDNYVLKHDTAPGGELDFAQWAGIADLYADVERVDPASVPFVGFADIHRFTTMLMEPNTFLPAVQRDFLLQGGRIVVRDFHTPSEIAALREGTIFNCTGLGSRALFGDTMLEPVRGQLTILEPQPDVEYIYLTPPSFYMFPRNDGIVLGGTFESGNWSTAVDLETQRRVLAAHEAIFAKT
ncbi:MAG TPA: FAD-dependent oxidoreductase [Candidatus Cybelea sp.]|jgi:glycine/D-amino acid oxidase-like deaminating enzyme|nr:FAD-dependent oxidoreductase [Candidatus Cybelea sp.]